MKGDSHAPGCVCHVCQPYEEWVGESRESVVEHEHEWKLPEGGFVVIDTLPEQYPYRCECGAFTHDPESGTPCSICAPNDSRLAALTTEQKPGKP